MMHSSQALPLAIASPHLATVGTASHTPGMQFEQHLLPQGSNEANMAQALGAVASRLRQHVPVQLDLQQQELNCTSRAVAHVHWHKCCKGAATSNHPLAANSSCAMGA